MSGEAICAECGLAVLPSLARDSSGMEQGFSCRRLKCHECAQQISNADDVDPANVAADEAMRDVPAEYDRRYAPTDDDSESSRYPSKLVALLDDIIHHYDQDKRYTIKFNCGLLIVNHSIASSSRRGSRAWILWASSSAKRVSSSAEWTATSIHYSGRECSRNSATTLRSGCC